MARPPVVLIHGAFSQAVHFAGWARALSEAGYDCHRPSLPGHGSSDPAALARLTFGDYLAALRQLTGTLAAPPVIIGHSMGGLLGQHWLRPHRARRWCASRRLRRGH
jgi:alpha-beta hydrolase superfamily lysophospholipase